MTREIIKNYRNEDSLRNSFNELAKITFQINFEQWYQNGYWTDNYNPYSIVADGKVVANVSVNKINMMWNGEKKHLIQLGTVMTAKEYRNQGLIRRIMEEIDKDYRAHCDGMFLFANDRVLDFYPKFGFQKADQYQYSKAVSNTLPRTVIRVPMERKKDWDTIKDKIDNSMAFYGFDMVDNSDLYLFYLSQFMKENVYYLDELKAYVVAEEEESELFIHAIFGGKPVSIDDIIKAFGETITSVRLGFVPDQRDEYLCERLTEEDTTLFVKGDLLEGFSEKQWMFPTLSHA